MCAQTLRLDAGQALAERVLVGLLRLAAGRQARAAPHQVGDAANWGWACCAAIPRTITAW